MERHGIFVTEKAAEVITPVPLNITLPVVIGTAPVNLTNAALVNKPVLLESWNDVVTQMGYSEDWSSFTLSEFAHYFFKVAKLAPVVFINVLDPVKHKTAVAADSATLVNGAVTIGVQGIMKSSVVITSSDAATTYVVDKDYTLSFNAVGELVVTRLVSGALVDNSAIKIAYDKLDRSKVTSSDIIGGVVEATGAATGLALLDQIFPMFRIVPALVAAPGFSDNPTIAAIMVEKASNMNGGHFKAQAITDLPADQIYTNLPMWKKSNAYTDPRQINTYPLLTKDGKTYHASTVTAARIVQTDLENGGVPSVSPSNKSIPVDGMKMKDREITLGPQQGQYLNANGIVTALNFVGGFVLWGNRTGVFPDQKDPQSSFIPVRRMFDWVANTVTLTYWKYLDGPIDKRIIEAITDANNFWLNGLSAAGYILGGRIEFNASENPTADLMDGKMKFHIYLTPPSPAQDIEYVLEYDAAYFAALFSTGA